MPRQTKYEKLGFKAGLECHQQIEAGGKLFCRCQCIIKDGDNDFTFRRKLRASASELGEMDPAAMYELAKGKYFVYNGYNDANCLVEMDESPPEELNKDALNIALQVALLLNAAPVDAVQFMRKVVIDGSNVSGFQRTAVIATNGFIETSQGKISIPTICLEEEAAKKIEDTGEYRTYNISRMGIPLIEIATSPDIKSPGHAKETAEKIGMVLRSVKGIKRGLGSIRQDVNLSIKGHPRVEIKGFQDLKSIPDVMEFEIRRQQALKKKHQRLKPEVRKAEPDFKTSFLRPMPGAARMYPETDVPLIKITKEFLGAIKLPELIAEKVANLEEKYGLPEELAREIIKNEIDISSYAEKYKNIEPKTIAHIIIEIPKEIKSRFSLDSSKLKDREFDGVLRLINENKIDKSSAVDVLADLIKEGKIDFKKYEKISDKDLERQIRKIAEKNKGASFGAMMGEAMRLFKGKAEPKKISELVKKYSV